MTYSRQQTQALLKLARDSIASGLQHHRALQVNPGDFEPALQENKACFVTLLMNHQLRGCIGSLQACRPLVVDVAENAFAAAFRHPGFPPLSDDEFERISLSISVLTPAIDMSFASEADLISQLQPGIDGLVLTEGSYRGTFLPSVWEQLPDPVEFIRHLKQKAGLAPGYWSDTLKVSRYHSEYLS